MTLRYFLLFLLMHSACAASVEDSLKTLRRANVGYVAFCRQSVVDELQLLAAPRELSHDEVKALVDVLGTKESYFQKLSDGTSVGWPSMCDPHWDFKLFLASADGETLLNIRLCSDCGALEVSLNGVRTELPALLKPARADLAKLFDQWFPGWAELSASNREKWDKEARERQRRFRALKIGSSASDD